MERVDLLFSNHTLRGNVSKAAAVRVWCSALANPHRARLTCLVAARPGLVSTLLSSLLELSLPLLNYHASRLVAAGLIRREKKGRARYLYLNERSKPQLQALLSIAHAITELQP